MTTSVYISGSQAIRISGTICAMYGIIYCLNYSFKQVLKYAMSGPNTPIFFDNEFCEPLSMILTGDTMLLVTNNIE